MGKRALVFADYTNPKWHPGSGVIQELATILKGEVELSCTENYGSISRDALNHFDLVVSYADCWKEKGTADLTDAVLSFVAGGGSFLGIHNGIIAADPALFPMFGAKFIKHPPSTELEYAPVGDHQIIAGIAPFSLQEEPYQFQFDVFGEKTVLLQYIYEDQLWPVAWVHDYVKGHVVYLGLGHNQQAFKHPTFRQLIVNSCRWLVQS